MKPLLDTTPIVTLYETFGQRIAPSAKNASVKNEKIKSEQNEKNTRNVKDVESASVKKRAIDAVSENAVTSSSVKKRAIDAVSASVSKKTIDAVSGSDTQSYKSMGDIKSNRNQRCAS
jgi:hypothetical protein